MAIGVEGSSGQAFSREAIIDCRDTCSENQQTRNQISRWRQVSNSVNVRRPRSLTQESFADQSGELCRHSQQCRPTRQIDSSAKPTCARRQYENDLLVEKHSLRNAV